MTKFLFFVFRRAALDFLPGEAGRVRRKPKRRQDGSAVPAELDIHLSIRGTEIRIESNAAWEGLASMPSIGIDNHIDRMCSQKYRVQLSSVM